jgi:hypothetical protein
VVGLVCAETDPVEEQEEDVAFIHPSIIPADWHRCQAAASLYT